jgi:hypothetical protein
MLTDREDVCLGEMKLIKLDEVVVKYLQEIN